MLIDKAPYRVGGGTGASPFTTSLTGMGVILRRFGDSFRELTPPRSSPTMMMGLEGLNTTWVNRARFTTFCSHSCSCLFTCRSYTCT
jgi:hypothetical protein